MKYLLLIHQGDTPTPRDPEAWATLSEDEQKAVFADYQAINQTPGVTPGLGLDAPETATTVRVQDGKTLTTDGPFVEIKEAVGGYLLFEADDLVVGRQLYRKFCGQCHALSAANAAGFGSNTKGGFGDLGGPSFNELRVPYAFSVTAVVEPTGGHEVLKKKITAKQLHAVAAYIARVTRNHPVPAFPTSG